MKCQTCKVELEKDIMTEEYICCNLNCNETITGIKIEVEQ
jgi:hypothetical protein